jgi:hypothetical protein
MGCSLSNDIVAMYAFPLLLTSQSYSFFHSFMEVLCICSCVMGSIRIVSAYDVGGHNFLESIIVG